MQAKNTSLCVTERSLDLVPVAPTEPNLDRSKAADVQVQYFANLWWDASALGIPRAPKGTAAIPDRNEYLHGIRPKTQLASWGIQNILSLFCILPQLVGKPKKLETI